MIKPWKKLDNVEVYKGYRIINKVTFELPNSQPADFDIRQDVPAFCVLALTPDKQIILAKQFRPGPEQVLIELPGGVGDPEESYEQSAARELLEETGYAGEMNLIASGPVDAYSTRIRHHFVALNCKKIAEPLDDPREQIEVVLMPLEQFKKHLRSAQLTDVATGFLGLDFLGL